MTRPIVAAGIAAACVLAGFAASRLFAEDPAPSVSGKEAKVRKVLLLTGAEQSAKLAYEKMLKQFDAMPGLPAGFGAKFAEKVTAKDMVELNVPVYVKHYDEKTLDAAIAFYESADGKAFAAKLPTVVSEVTDAGMELGQRVGMEVAIELAGGGEDAGGGAK